MSNRRVELIYVVIFTLIGDFEAFDFPSDFELCHRYDQACIVRRANEIIHNHPQGYPEIFLRAFDPLRLKKLEVPGNPNNSINFRLQMTNISVTGYSNMTFTNISGFDKDPSKMIISTESFNPRVIMQGKYKLSGRLLFFSINGEGNCEIIMLGLKIATETRPSFTVQNGKAYLKSSSYKLFVSAENMKIHLTNLLNGNKLLSENMLRMINDNWKLIWNQMSARFNEEIAAENVQILDAIFKQIAYNDMFLPD